MKTICCDGWSMVTSAMGERAALYGHQVKHRVMMEDMLVNVDDCTLAGTVGGAVKESDIQIQWMRAGKTVKHDYCPLTT